MDNEKILEMKEADIISKLKGEFEVPKTTVVLDRLGIPLAIKGLTEKEFNRLKKECTVYKKENGVRQEKLNGPEYDAAVIISATTNFDWNNPDLLAAKEVSDGKTYIRRTLLAGEINKIVAKILELSGYDSELEEVEDIKNSSAEEE